MNRKNKHPSALAKSIGLCSFGIMAACGPSRATILTGKYSHLNEFPADGRAGTYIQKRIDTALFDMVHDPYEKINVFTEYPEIAKQLIEYAEEHKEKFFE